MSTELDFSSLNPMTPYDRALYEPLRLLAETNGELDHIIPDLRMLAVPMAVLNLDPLNAQEHDPRNIKVICGSFQKYGQRDSITVNWKDNVIPNRITVGNGRYTSAKMLGWTWIAAAGTEDNEEDAMAWGMLDNRSSALAKMNYSQASSNAKRLKAAGHPVLDLMFPEDEVLPLLHDEYQPPAPTDEQFDSTMLKGRAIRNITASERLTIDQAIELRRAQSSRALTEGSALESICKEYLEITAVTAAVNSEIGETPEDVLPLI